MITRIWAVTLTVGDLERAVDFYGRILGLDKECQYRDYAGFDCGGVELGLKTWGELEPPRKGEPCLDLLVHDVDQAVGKLTQSGVRILLEPEETQWGGRIARFSDPDGYVLQLTQIDWPRYFTVCARK